MCKEKDFSWLVFIIIFIVLITISAATLYCFRKVSICNVYYAVTIWAVIITLILNIYTSLNKIRQEKLNHAVLLVQNFDSDSLRCARDFSRRFKEDHDNNNLPNDLLIKFIDGKLEETKNVQWKNQYNINDTEKLKSSIIHLFNYFQSVYTELSCNTADKEYLLHCLSYVYIDIFNRFKKWLEEHSNTGDKLQLIDLNNFYKLANEYIEKIEKKQKKQDSK